MSDRQGIEIDYCPQCRGVWLDRGELDKIIERNATTLAAGPSGGFEQPSPRGGDPRDYDDRGGHQGSGHGYGRRGRKKSFLAELFD
jgi:Zn-finger nucleic acid-binding protein